MGAPGGGKGRLATTITVHTTSWGDLASPPPLYEGPGGRGWGNTAMGKTMDPREQWSGQVCDLLGIYWGHFGAFGSPPYTGVLRNVLWSLGRDLKLFEAFSQPIKGVRTLWKEAELVRHWTLWKFTFWDYFVAH